MQLAPISRKDMPVLAELLRASVPSLVDLDAAQLEEQTFGDPAHDISFLLQALDKNKPVGVVLGVTRKIERVKTGWLKVFAVHPGHRGQGLGKQLFSEVERRFQKREVREIHTGQCPAPLLVQGVSVEDTDTVSFLVKRGYSIRKTIVDMTADLSDFNVVFSAEDKALIKSAGIRQAKEVDMAAVQEFVGSQFPEWAWETKTAVRDGILFAAFKGKKVTAFAAGNATALGWFGPMGTSAAERGKGLGRILMWNVLEQMKKKKFNSVRIPDVGPIPFYRKHASAVLGPLSWDLVKRV